ncbi:hypothetical protein FEM03_06345 [Phragmitibacter flavus]|uniref:PEP-CTERM sorting domain-containing protein n=1 Tax=Phragmitibacter flavus TaxID=2576071 RepID=A0A5R8KIH3_9BACT|nr:hypothetical protein [Phragmitibacter flavus]TLD71755.1 hypothetical protein FEM03_06345 [Phragmitibacter flavus]
MITSVRLLPMVAAFGITLHLAPQLNAAVLAGQVFTNPGVSAVDLTATGSVDWAIWDFTQVSAPFPTTVAATNGKAGGTANISVISTVGGGSLRGSGGSSIGLKNFSYSDGNSPTSLTNLPQSLVFNSSLDAGGLNRGVQLSLSGDPAQEYLVSVWATGFNAQGTMTATLNGATAVTLQSQEYSNSKQPTLFTFTFRPDVVGDLLNLSYVMTTDTTGTNSHVGIQAVTVSVVPEPTQALLCLLGLVGLTQIRRRR